MFWSHDLTTFNHLTKLIRWFCAAAGAHSSPSECSIRAAVTHATAQNHSMSLMRWLKVAKSSYENVYFTKIEKQFFRYHDGIIPACCILKGCCGACSCTKPPNELDEVVKSGQIMLPKRLFYKNRKTIFFDIMMAQFQNSWFLDFKDQKLFLLWRMSHSSQWMHVSSSTIVADDTSLTCGEWFIAHTKSLWGMTHVDIVSNVS